MDVKWVVLWVVDWVASMVDDLVASWADMKVVVMDARKVVERAGQKDA